MARRAGIVVLGVLALLIVAASTNAIVVWRQVNGVVYDPFVLGGVYGWIAGVVAFASMADLVGRDARSRRIGAVALLVSLSLALVLGPIWTPGEGLLATWPRALAEEMLAWSAFTGAAALVVAHRGEARVSRLALAGLAAFALAAAPAALVEGTQLRGGDVTRYGLLLDVANSWPHGLVAWLSGLALASALAWRALRGEGLAPAPERGAFAPRGSWAAGASLLVLSWMLGGNFLFLPLWPFPLALLALPALLDARRAWLPAVLIVAVLSAGLLHVPACEVEATPAPPLAPPGTTPTPQYATPRLLEVAARGPLWSGFSGPSITCGVETLAAATLWATLLAAVAAWRGPRR